MCDRVVRAVLLLLASGLSIAGEPPASGLSCERLVVIAEDTLKYRDEGYTLSQVLAAVKGLQSEGKLTAAEVETVRKTITMTYMSSATPREVATECLELQKAKKR